MDTAVSATMRTWDERVPDHLLAYGAEAALPGLVPTDRGFELPPGAP